ncbi:MAG: glycoside hydrolase family 9 protein [Halococcoides sp.]
MAAGVGLVAAGSPLVSGTGFAGTPATTDSGAYNYSHALQQSLYFYDANRCGPKGENDRLPWRGDCHTTDTEIPLTPISEKGAAENGVFLSESFIEEHRDILDPEGTGTVDLAGGYHDAGDHVKFGLPQSYAASTLGWELYEFPEAFKTAGQYEDAKRLLKGFTDYFLKGTFRNDAGDVVAFCYQVGEGTVDHNYWGPPELQRTSEQPRPAYFATANRPGSDQTAGAAAALAVASLVFEDDPNYAAECLDAAKALYPFARNNRGLGYNGGFYGSSYDEDELAWAAVWLHIATGDQQYIDHITATDDQGNFTGYLGRIIASEGDDWQNIWVHSWDTVWGGVFLKLAAVTDNERWWSIARWNIEYWTGGAVEHKNGDSNYISTTPNGFSVLSTWGSARYNAAAQFCAMVYRKYRDTDHARALTDWAKTQMDYIMGENPFGYSLIVGFGADGGEDGKAHARHPHHRAAHGSLTNSMDEPTNHRHTLWGGLVGGPDEEGVHKDVTSNFVYNEVAIDFNVGLVGALAGFVEFYDEGEPIEEFPPADPPLDETIEQFPPMEPPIDPYFATAEVLQETNARTQVRITLYNRSFNPPHYEDGLSARYFFDISELREVGQTIDAVSVSVMYDGQKARYEGECEVTGPHAYDEEAGIYYVDMDWSGPKIYGKRELQIAIVADQADDYEAHWDPTNDPSYQGIGQDGASVVPEIPVYLDGELVYGTEPDGGSGPPPIDGVQPTDPDGDGLYEDLSGNSQIGFPDVNSFFQHSDSAVIQDHAEFYDFTGEGTINLQDVMALFQMV